MAEWRDTAGGRLIVALDTLRAAARALVDVLPFGPLGDDGFCSICARYDGHKDDCEWDVLSRLVAVPEGDDT